MPQSTLEMAKDLVIAMIQSGHLPPEEMQTQLQKTHTSLVAMKAQEELGLASGAENGAGSGPVDWKRSIKKYTIECLICGASFKQLSVRHLKNHELDPGSYRARFGIPRAQPLSAKDTTAMRKKIVQESRPWEKAPTFMKAQSEKSGNGAAPKAARGRKKAPSKA